MKSRPIIDWNVSLHPGFLPSHHRLRSWRDEPATFPRLSSVRLCSPFFPWVVDVSNKRGVRCIDVLVALWRLLDAELDSPLETPEATYEVYEGVVEVSLPLQRNRDFLGARTVWRGLHVDLGFAEKAIRQSPGVTLVVEFSSQ